MTDREETLKFTSSVIMLSKLLTKVEDRFLAHKLYEKISDMVEKFVTSYSPASVSHNVNRQSLVYSINNLLDFIEYLAHDSKSDTTPLLVVQKNLLKFKLNILKKHKLTKVTAVAQKFNNENVFSSTASKTKTSFKNRSTNLVLKVDSNKEKIFNFVKKFPETRTKEIIDEFNVLSGRTVKRNLKELVNEGLLAKKIEGNAVYYLLSSIQY